jgi:hypothetical protein
VPGRLNALIGKLAGEKKEGEKAGRGGICAAAAAGRRGRGKKKRKGGRERLTGGARVSVSAKKRKGERERRTGAGWLAGLAGLAGPKGEQGTVFFFLKLLFQTTFLLKFKSKLLQTFSQKFINFL